MWKRKVGFGGRKKERSVGNGSNMWRNDLIIWQTA